MIKIGLSPCFLGPDTSRTVHGPKNLVYVEQDMATYLERKGVWVILLLPHLPQNAEAIVDSLDGLVLQGGHDVCPESYHEPYLDKVRWPGDRYRDDVELKYLELAQKKGLPTLGICRGIQILNVHCGGTLYQDLELEGAVTRSHIDSRDYDQHGHQIDLNSKGQLQKWYGGSQFEVNSIHHQGIKKLGPSLISEATSADGLIEAVSFADFKQWPAMGVQWHPEFQTRCTKFMNPYPLLDGFLKLCQGQNP